MGRSTRLYCGLSDDIKNEQDSQENEMPRMFRSQSPSAVLCVFSRLSIIVFAIPLLCASTALASSQDLTTLHSFCSQANCADGDNPNAPLVQGADGSFYGTTLAGGGAQNAGVIFRVAPDGTFTVLHTFCALANCADGSWPVAGLLQSTDGSFYGTTSLGGASNGGTIFHLSSTGVFSTVYSFCSQPNCSDGRYPMGMIRGADGNLYGVTNHGGNHNSYCANECGTIFKLSPSGGLTTIYRFCAQQHCPDGGLPQTLIQGTDGALYGTTTFPTGTTFQLTPNGTLQTLYTFCQLNYCADGEGPNALLEAVDGKFYGTTDIGGMTEYCTYQCGTIYSITSSGSFLSIYDFCSQPSCADGTGPNSMFQAPDGNLYGTTTGGGIDNEYGVVFKFSLPGTLTLLYQFCSLANCADGEAPQSLMQGSDGNLYGVTFNGGANGSGGTVFKLTGPAAPAMQFVPVPGCRLSDTRQTHSPIQGGAWQSFVVPELGDCNIPASATAYSLNVTAVPHGPLQYLTVWPAGKSQPFVSTMNSLDGRTKAIAAIVTAGASGAVNIFATNTTDIVIDIDGYFAPPSASTLQFYPLKPCRVADTRSSSFPQGLGTPHLSQGVARDFPVLNAASCNIPASAQAYSLNFTAIPYPSLGDPLAYLEVWPTGEQPGSPVSTLNNPTGTYVANAAIVPAGSGGSTTAFGSDDTDLAIDINGYFAAPGTGGLSLYSTIPCRVIDTRQIGNGQPFSGTLNPPVDVVTSPCGIPATAQAYVFNATVVPSPNLSYLTLWPDGQGQPVVSTLNAADGWITSNMAIVPNNGDGKIDAYAAGVTQLILDISSYFAP
jgi:uncharacterized repeat protein (TIGR03803 family)